MLPFKASQTLAMFSCTNPGILKASFHLPKGIPKRKNSPNWMCIRRDSPVLSRSATDLSTTTMLPSLELRAWSWGLTETWEGEGCFTLWETQQRSPRWLLKKKTKAQVCWVVPSLRMWFAAVNPPGTRQCHTPVPAPRGAAPCHRSAAARCRSTSLPGINISGTSCRAESSKKLHAHRQVIGSINVCGDTVPGGRAVQEASKG